jgi:hypothetical protein
MKTSMEMETFPHRMLLLHFSAILNPAHALAVLM